MYVHKVVFPLLLTSVYPTDILGPLVSRILRETQRPTRKWAKEGHRCNRSGMVGRALLTKGTQAWD